MGNIKELYEQVFTEVYPQVKAHGRGLLYKVIQIIMGEEQLQTQEKTLEICDYLGIQPNAYRKDDRRILDDLTEVIEDKHPSINKVQGVAKFVRSFITTQAKDEEIEKMEEIEMKWIIVGACILIGLPFCIRYINKAKRRKMERNRRVREFTDQQSPPQIPAALCLVVPAKIASTLKTGSSLSAIDVEHLIDNASYFLCVTLRTANSSEESLDLTDEHISPDSQREVYIRVDINDGRELIDKKIPYILKTNLPSTAQFVVKKLNCLRNLSGLEEFNRI